METHGYPSIICLTPVKNEAWILDRFLRCASLWADYIIIADQGSTDSSREIALRYPKVVLIDNLSLEFSEVQRQQLLLDAARQIDGPPRRRRRRTGAPVHRWRR
jgi:glycosyltransferase involved in cell wall biosynthesis